MARSLYGAFSEKIRRLPRMLIAGEYSDEGKSGKSVEDRPQFQQMLKDIKAGKDNIDFVLVFKLSRFDRNAADVLSSLQRMQDFGVKLICDEISSYDYFVEEELKKDKVE